MIIAILAIDNDSNYVGQNPIPKWELTKHLTGFGQGLPEGRSSCLHNCALFLFFSIFPMLMHDVLTGILWLYLVTDQTKLRGTISQIHLIKIIFSVDAKSADLI